MRTRCRQVGFLAALYCASSQRSIFTRHFSARHRGGPVGAQGGANSERTRARSSFPDTVTGNASTKAHRRGTA